MSYLRGKQDVEVRVKGETHDDNYEIEVLGGSICVGIYDVEIDQDMEVEVCVDDDMVMEAFDYADYDDLRSFMDRVVSTHEAYAKIMLAAILADAAPGNGQMTLDAVVRECFDAAEEAGVTLAYESIGERAKFEELPTTTPGCSNVAVQDDEWSKS